MIEEDYVSYDTLVLLKHAGYPLREVENQSGYYIPTLCKAMRWLREEKKIQINIGFYIDRDKNGKQINGRWRIDFRKIPTANPNNQVGLKYLYDPAPYPKTYEAAAEAGIKAACKYIIEINQNQ